MEEQILLDILAELERRQVSRDMNRYLRDISNPFFIPEEQFRKHYRLSREVAREVFLQIQIHLDNGQRNTKVPPVVKFITALHFFAHGSYQKSIGKDQHCSISQSVVSKSLHEITEVMIRVLANEYIRFPRNPEDMLQIKMNFFEKYNFPGIIGCLDETFVRIFPPPANDPVYPGNVFINRKHFHSLNVLLVCDANLSILTINARYPGSVHDSAVYTMSRVKQLLHLNYEQGERSSWLLGDAGYPLEAYLLTPIVGADPNTPQGRYTKAHQLARNCVERCIGVLKSYFRCLLQDRVLHYRPPVAANIIYCCAILHNILRQRNLLDEDIAIQHDEPWDNDDNGVIEDGNNLLRQGQLIRNNVIRTHFL